MRELVRSLPERAENEEPEQVYKQNNGNTQVPGVETTVHFLGT